jgi:transforming growth factor-beta-induced protein
LTKVLQYHVVAGTVARSLDLSNNQVIATLASQSATVTIDGSTVKVNNATVTLANTLAKNAVIHVIDKVLMPVLPAPTNTIVQNAVATPSLSTLVSVLQMPAYKPVLDLLSGAGTYTVFAPDNNAFAAAGLDTSQAAYVTQILNYHVLGATVKAADLVALQFPQTLMKDQAYVNLGTDMPQVLGVSKNGATVTINFGIAGEATLTATVSTADVVCSNGVVHIIDKVLMFPKKVSETATDASLSELVAALTKASLVSTIDDTASLTIFAPTNAALQAANWQALSVPDLTKVLQYHVVAGTVARSLDLSNNQVIATLASQNATVTIDGSTVKVNDATVTLANTLAKNAVIHVIDKVLMPNLMPMASAGTTVAPVFMALCSSVFAIVYLLS